MFDLEQAIADWRREMRAAGLGNREQLDELESHLREDVDAQTNAVIAVREAFDAAVQRLGGATALETEFQAAEADLPMKNKSLEILIIVGALFIELGFILPAVARLRAHEPFDTSGAIAGLSGVALFAATLLYAGVVTVKRLKNRPRA